MTLHDITWITCHHDYMQNKMLIISKSPGMYWGCINIQYIPIHAGCIGMYQKIRRMYWDVSKDVLDVNTSNTSSNTSDVLKNGKMYSSVLKDVLDVFKFKLFNLKFSWQDVLPVNDVLMIAPGCIKWGTGDVLRCI